MFDDFFRYESHRHFHVFVPIKRCLEIQMFDIGSTKLGTRHAGNTVPHHFCRDHVGRVRNELAWVID